MNGLGILAKYQIDSENINFIFHHMKFYLTHR